MALSKLKTPSRRGQLYIGPAPPSFICSNNYTWLNLPAIKENFGFFTQKGKNLCLCFTKLSQCPRPYLSLIDSLNIVTYYLEKKSFNSVLTVNLPRTAPVTIYTRNTLIRGLITQPRVQVEGWSFQNIASPAFQDNIC